MYTRNETLKVSDDEDPTRERTNSVVHLQNIKILTAPSALPSAQRDLDSVVVKLTQLIPRSNELGA